MSASGATASALPRAQTVCGQSHWPRLARIPQKDLAPGCLLPPRVETERLKHERRPMERELAPSQGPAPPRNHSSLAAIRTNDPQHPPCLRCGQSHWPQTDEAHPKKSTPHRPHAIGGASQNPAAHAIQHGKRPNGKRPNAQPPTPPHHPAPRRTPQSSILDPPSSIFHPRLTPTRAARFLAGTRPFLKIPSRHGSVLRSDEPAQADRPRRPRQ
jgi:hypothetical protein